MVANALVYHPAVAHYLRFVATTVGRDKALRTIQYFSRFLAWYLYRTNHPQTTVKIAEASKKQLGAVRKGMRLGKFVEHFKAAAVAADNKSLDPVLRNLAIGRQLGYGFYMFFDFLAYVDTAGIYKFEGAKRLSQNAQRAWFTGLVCNILAGFYTLYNLHLAAQQKQASSDPEKAVELKKLESTRRTTQTQLLSDLCDVTLPGTGLGYFSFDDGMLGLFGTVSSLIGLRSAWRKTA